MTTGTIALTAALTILFLLVLRWSHRSWSKAILSALFTPLVAVPIAGVGFMAVALILRILNGFLSGFGVSFPNTTLTVIAGTITTLLVLFLAFLYCREQRSLSLVTHGPRFGPRYIAPTPKINQRGRIR